MGKIPTSRTEKIMGKIPTSRTSSRTDSRTEKMGKIPAEKTSFQKSRSGEKTTFGGPKCHNEKGCLAMLRPDMYSKGLK
jgi:predicted acyltransferase (DUF342 family)